MNTGSIQPINHSSSGSGLLLGTDLVYIPRLITMHERFGVRAFQKLLSDAELNDATHPQKQQLQFEKLAARIATKEALAKALGVGLNGLGWGEGIDWLDVTVVRNINAPPRIQLQGRALQFAQAMGVTQWQLSLSHDGDYAMATVIGCASKT